MSIQEKFREYCQDNELERAGDFVRHAKQKGVEIDSMTVWRLLTKDGHSVNEDNRQKIKQVIEGEDEMSNEIVMDLLKKMDRMQAQLEQKDKIIEKLLGEKKKDSTVDPSKIGEEEPPLAVNGE